MLRPPENINNAASTRPNGSSGLQLIYSKDQLVKMSSEELAGLLISVQQENISREFKIVELEKENAFLNSKIERFKRQIEGFKQKIKGLKSLLSEKDARINNLLEMKAGQDSLLNRMLDKVGQPQTTNITQYNEGSSHNDQSRHLTAQCEDSASGVSAIINRLKIN